jgi:hypothetical protein
VGHTVQLEATVKLLRDAGRQLRPDFLGPRHQAAFPLDPDGRPGPRRLRVFDPGGRPGPRRLRRRLRPFFAFLLGFAVARSPWIVSRTCC